MMRDHINMPQKICIVGLGQMGGSIAKALKEKNKSVQVIGWARKQEYIDDALKNNYIDEGYTDIETAISDADFSVLALPIEALISFVKDHGSKFKKGSIVTDVSSIKALIVEEVRPVFSELGIHFIGSHPMAGNEKSGLEHAATNLYEKAIIFICSYCTDDPAAVNIVREFWRELGSTPYEVDAIEHDKVVAATSHALHITSSVSTRIALEEHDYDLAKLACAGSFRDTSRVAGSDPKMWTTITKTNKSAVLGVLNQTMSELETLKQAIENDEWETLESYLGRGKELREKWWDDYQELKK